MEATALRIREGKASDRYFARMFARKNFRQLIARIASLGAFVATCTPVRADIPWPEVTQRLAYENEKLARRPQGHNGEYFIVCTLYYTPMESGFTAERGFDATLVTKPGLHGRKYPRDFLVSVRKEGFGRLREPVNGCNYIRYNGGNSYTFTKHAVGRGIAPLI